ncbi:cation-translocating P-type ATPase [Luteibacter sp. UNCMF366Tsu5.1]|uniref:cation-translocating P-type ATPase n=1 Tax=Luteibacter sp. UNCMF366Tsu5.1 TaxID=1502758 RepID=UPI00092FF8B4|nr:cation-translocating P-type ATPase [Luteibacter sp. UNCMF366Tsu5.1]
MMGIHATSPHPDDTMGLSEAEACERLQRDGPNVLIASEGFRSLRVLRELLREPMLLMLIAAAAIYGAIGSAAEALFLAASVLIVVGITFAQEFRAEGALAALRELAAPTAHVIREAGEREIPASAVVLGDVVLLREGDKVPADGMLVAGTILLDESLLTGESVAVQRSAGDAQDHAVHAATLVVGGNGRMHVTAIGARTAVGQIGGALAGALAAPSALQKAAARIVRLFAVFALALALAVAWGSWWWAGSPPLNAALAGIALAMAVLPEEVPVILAVFYALGARRIAHHGVLTRRLAAVEAMGTISLLAVDKTGTLTQNQMEVASVTDATGVLRDLAGPLDDADVVLLGAASDACQAHSMDPTDRAIVAYATHRLDDIVPAGPPGACVWETPVSEGRPFVSRLLTKGSAGWVLATKGAPEAILALCDVDDDTRSRLRACAAAFAQRGMRVLAVAVAHGTGVPPTRDGPGVRQRFLGLMALADPLREEVPAAIGVCREAGIRVVMLTGDHPATASSIGAQAGLRVENVLTGAELDGVSEPELARRLVDVDVYARVQPTQKLRLVKAFRRAGYVVGMTGDGVNDAPALRSADVGVAMGARGSEVARDSADLVLLDDRFSSLVTGIRLGRRVYDNVKRSMRFVSAVHVPIVCLAIVPVVLRWPPVLLPVQIALLEMIIDPACSIVFEAMPERPDVMRHAPRRPNESPFAGRNIGIGIAQGLGAGAILTLAHMISLHLGASYEAASLATFLGLLGAALMLAFAGRGSPRVQATPWLMGLGALVLAVGLSTSYLPWLRGLLHFAPPTAMTLATLAGSLVALRVWLVVVALLERRLLVARRPASLDASRASPHHAPTREIPP